MVLVDARKQLDEPKVHEIVTLGKHDDTTAKQLLTQAAKQVQPIMRKRGWVVPKLSEFYPKNHNLLGLNIGGGGGRTREVKVRLRKPHDETVFYPFNDVLGTMLHELVHNVRGPHDSVFYKLLDELWTEAEDLMDRGITGSGSGFEGPSAGRLGSHAFIPLHNPPEGRAREVALKAAEERAKRQRLMSAGPCRLGGGGPLRHLTPGQAAAQAAERRARDNLWCPCEQLSNLQLGGMGGDQEGEAGHQQASGQGQGRPVSGSSAGAVAGGVGASAAGKSGAGGGAGEGPKAGGVAVPRQQGQAAGHPQALPPGPGRSAAPRLSAAAAAAAAAAARFGSGSGGKSIDGQSSGTGSSAVAPAAARASSAGAGPPAAATAGGGSSRGDAVHGSSSRLDQLVHIIEDDDSPGQQRRRGQGGMEDMDIRSGAWAADAVGGGAAAAGRGDHHDLGVGGSSVQQQQAQTPRQLWPQDQGGVSKGGAGSGTALQTASTALGGAHQRPSHLAVVAPSTALGGRGAAGVAAAAAPATAPSKPVGATTTAASVVVDLTADSDDDDHGVKGGTAAAAATAMGGGALGRGRAASAVPLQPSGGGPWQCPACTLINRAAALCCDACASERPWRIA